MLGDISYGGNKIVYGGGNSNFKSLANKLLNIAVRQMLHAKVLGFNHPVLKEDLLFETNLPEDMQNIKTILDTSLIE